MSIRFCNYFSFLISNFAEKNIFSFPGAEHAGGVKKRTVKKCQRPLFGICRGKNTRGRSFCVHEGLPKRHFFLCTCLRAPHGDPLHRLRRSPTSGLLLECFRCVRRSRRACRRSVPVQSPQAALWPRRRDEQTGGRPETSSRANRLPSSGRCRRRRRRGSCEQHAKTARKRHCAPNKKSGGVNAPLEHSTPPPFLCSRRARRDHLHPNSERWALNAAAQRPARPTGIGPSRFPDPPGAPPACPRKRSCRPPPRRRGPYRSHSRH